ncbi:MAG: hypothetical protein NZ700_04760 [Gemmataceae bacterium]|nr:hypothetical protein [Gemmataceae bacterium]MDW8264054.1 hypothetical protein [Gemmataceae bacterium]
MRRPQVVVYEEDGKLARILTDTCRERKWLLRQPRQPGACLRLLRRGGPAVLVLKVHRPQVRDPAMLDALTASYKELAGQRRRLADTIELLDRVTWLLPDVNTLVVGETDDPPLAGLAWDLGARFVLFPPHPLPLVIDLVTHLMERTLGEAGSSAPVVIAPDNEAAP